MKNGWISLYPADTMDRFINKRFSGAQHMGIIGAAMFPWSKGGEDWWIYKNVSENAETHDINHYLQEAKIGYTFLLPKGGNIVSDEDEDNYKRIFRIQRERKL